MELATRQERKHQELLLLQCACKQIKLVQEERSSSKIISSNEFLTKANNLSLVRKNKQFSLSRLNETEYRRNY